MNSCPYCGSEVIMIKPNTYYCEFCELQGETPSADGKRHPVELKHIVTLSDANKSTPELMTYHVFDLLQLLKLLRDDRRLFYKQMTVFKNARKVTKDFIDDEKESAEKYQWQSRKVWVVENIIREKIGYIPKAVTEKLLGQWCDYMEYDEQRSPMTFRVKALNGK